MARMGGKIYQFEDYLLDVSEQRLQKDGINISLPPKVFDVLAALVKRHGQLVTYQELMDEVWRDTFVEETNLRYSIHALRKTFPEDFIETVPKRGYRFKPEVRSFTTEEFIKLHTGNFKKDDLMPPVEESSDKPKSAFVFGKYAVVAVIACLMTGVGLAAYYFWQKDDKVQAGKSAKTVAVAPFKIIGEDLKENRNFQKGLSDALFFELHKIKGLKAVQPPDAVDNAEKNPAADLVLEGSYRFESEQTVQVSLRLRRVGEEGKDLLNESISVKDEGKFRTEKVLALKIARRVFDKMAALADEEFVKTQNIGEEAGKNYLLGQQILRNSALFRQNEGVEAFEKVIRAEPQWAKGYAKLAEASVLLHGGLPDWEKARQIAETALAMDENLPEAHLAVGWFHQSKFDWENAERSFARALELDPEYSPAYNEYGLLLNVQRKFAEAEKKFSRAIELKPFDPFYLSSACQHYFYDRKADLAVKKCYESLDIDANYTVVNKQLFWIFVDLGDYGAAFKNDYGDLTEEEVARHSLAKPLKEGNLKLYWQKRIEERLVDKKRRSSPLTIAMFYAQLQDTENTLKYLEEMGETSPIDILYANPDPSFDFVRKDPRFINLLKKANLQP